MPFVFDAAALLQKNTTQKCDVWKSLPSHVEAIPSGELDGSIEELNGNECNAQDFRKVPFTWSTKEIGIKIF